MESKDKKYGFDFSGKYLRIIKNNEIEYELGDGRIVKIEFIQDNDKVLVRETFDAEKGKFHRTPKNRLAIHFGQL